MIIFFSIDVNILVRFRVWIKSTHKVCLVVTAVEFFVPISNTCFLIEVLIN